jgi:anaerobic magnesium-protoporphyrin IX monomethyl ester cyclase
MPDSTVRDDAVDIVVRGEGEQTALELAMALESGSALEEVEGITFVREGKVVHNRDRQMESLDSLPELPYHLLRLEDYLPVYKDRASLFFQSSRGCPMRCTYCYNRIYNRGKWRAQSAEKVIERLEFVGKRYPVEDIYFVDDNFFVDMDRAAKIVDWFAGSPLTWQVQGVEIVDLLNMDDSFLERLVASGCQRITIGVETGSPRMRKLMGKRGSVDDIVNAFRKLTRHEILVFCSFISGLPGESTADLKMTLELIFKLLEINPNTRNSPIYRYTPYPGTPLFHQAVRNGYPLPERLEDWAHMNWEDTELVPGCLLTDHTLRSLYFTSLFLDKKTREYSGSRLVKLLAGMYRPVARFRVRKMFFRFMLEMHAAKLLARWTRVH